MRRLAAFGGVVVLALAAVGAGWAMLTSNGTTIHACMNASNGNLRIANECREGELPISWPGTSLTLRSAYSEHTSVPPGQFRFANAICPTGTFVIGGGYATEDVSNAVLMPTNSYPVGMGDGRQAWYVVMRNLGPEEEAFWVWAQCGRSS